MIEEFIRAKIFGQKHPEIIEFYSKRPKFDRNPAEIVDFIRRSRKLVENTLKFYYS